MFVQIIKKETQMNDNDYKSFIEFVNRANEERMEKARKNDEKKLKSVTKKK